MSDLPKPKEDLAELGLKDDQTEDVVFGEITETGPNYRSVCVSGPLTPGINLTITSWDFLEQLFS